jgi:hypothetical protein
MDFNSNRGVGIGSIDSGSDIYITRSSVKILGSGNYLSGLGSLSKMMSLVDLYDTSVEVSLRSNESTCIGSLEGYTKLTTQNVGLKVENAGKNALAVGGKECETRIQLNSTDIRVDIHNSLGRDTYADEDNISIVNGRIKFMVNDQNIDRQLEFTHWDED